MTITWHKVNFIKQMKGKNKMKKNKWVMENEKWSEYKCIKFNTKNKDYMNVLNKAVKLHHEDIHYIVNTLEDILDNAGYQRNE